tara:strand:- start:928 stop:1263 length:336 start_codon:yes stop_codon:yes gene_type:complete
MKAHVIEKGLVTNTIEVSSLDFVPNLVEATEGGIGWSYSGGVFTEPADTRTEAEKALGARAERDAKLVESDWTQVIDASVDQAAWATYRQALRDIPAQAGFPNTIDWPTSP